MEESNVLCIQDPFVKEVERIVVDGLKRLEEGEEDDCELSFELASNSIESNTDEYSLESLKKQISINLSEVINDRTRQLLCDDKYILGGARRYGLSDNSQFIELDETTTKFYVPYSMFDLWKKQHESLIAGLKKEKRGQKNGGVSGKTRVRKPTIKTNCPSRLNYRIINFTLPDGRLEKVALVTYGYIHNHEVGHRITDVGSRQKSEAIKNTIRRLIIQGSTIQRVMQQLTMDYEKFTQILAGGGQSLSRDNFISYDDVVKWMQEFESKGYFTFYDKSHSQYFGFASPWQLHQLKAHGRTLCFDGTHQVFGHKSYLFTLVIKNADTGFGIPVAFLLTELTMIEVLTKWLKALREQMIAMFSEGDLVYTFGPEAIITDQGNLEIRAIKNSFPTVPIFYCAGHVLKVWERETPKSLSGLTSLSVNERKAIRAKCTAELRMILYNKNKEEADRQIAIYRQEWGEHDALLTYLTSNYFGPEIPKVLDKDKFDSLNIGQQEKVHVHPPMVTWKDDTWLLLDEKREDDEPDASRKPPKYESQLDDASTNLPPNLIQLINAQLIKILSSGESKWITYQAADGPIDLPPALISLINDSDQFKPESRDKFKQEIDGKQVGDRITLPSLGQEPKHYGEGFNGKSSFVTEQMMQVWDNFSADSNISIKRVLAGLMGVGKSYLALFLSAKAYLEGWPVLYVSDASELVKSDLNSAGSEICNPHISDTILSKLLSQKGKEILLIIDEHGNLFENNKRKPNLFEPLTNIHLFQPAHNGARVIYTGTAHAGFELIYLTGGIDSLLDFVGPFSDLVYDKLLESSPIGSKQGILASVKTTTNNVPRELVKLVDYLVNDRKDLKMVAEEIILTGIAAFESIRANKFYGRASSYFNKLNDARQIDQRTALSTMFQPSRRGTLHQNDVFSQPRFMDLGLIYRLKVNGATIHDT
ncbi:hypothetical protein BGZ46_010244 [Entomortierella lignicola]|nr:hypothetical protein BGZ46_010244 [Entomortierella lignicola]